MTIEPRRRVRPNEAKPRNAPAAHPSETAAQHAARLLAEDPERDWRLRDLAELVHLSTSQLGRTFSQRFGMPPMQYLAHVRAHRLAELLVGTDLPIGVAMVQVGWSSRGHAARQFTTIIGVSPSDYRRAATQGEGSPCPCCGRRGKGPL